VNVGLLSVGGFADGAGFGHPPPTPGNRGAIVVPGNRGAC
jgi:hypothetical protein